MSRSTRSDDPLELIGLHPNQFIHSLVSPKSQTFSAQLHGPSCHPKEDVTVILEYGNVKLPHFVVGHGSVRQFHVDIPGGICHHDGKLPQDGHVEVSQVALDPLRRIEGPRGVVELRGSRHVRPQPIGGRNERLALGQGQSEFGVRGIVSVRVIDLVVNVLAGVHVKAGVEEGTIAEGFVRVLVNDLFEVEFHARLAGVLLAFFPRAGAAKLSDLSAPLRPEPLREQTLFGGRTTEQLQNVFRQFFVLPLFGRLTGQETLDELVALGRIHLRVE